MHQHTVRVCYHIIIFRDVPALIAGCEYRFASRRRVLL